MTALPVLARPTIAPGTRPHFEPPILIRVPDVTAARTVRPGGAARRRIRRDRVALALAPFFGLSAWIVWSAVKPPAAVASARTPAEPVIQASFADPLPLAEPLLAPAVAQESPALVVAPAGYLIPDEEPSPTEGIPHAGPRR